MLRFIIWRKVKNTSGVQKKKKKGLCSVWRRYCDWSNTLKVVCKVYDAPQSGRPAEVDSNQIKTLFKNHQHYTTQETANILKISRSIKLLVKMKNVSFIFMEKKKHTDFLAHPIISNSTRKCRILSAFFWRQNPKFRAQNVYAYIPSNHQRKQRPRERNSAPQIMYVHLPQDHILFPNLSLK